ncbi:MAG: 3'-5' exonuclease [Oscillospiraceae bacterium]|nr:3'-5' exonuclease [Oscillospiraceae bacterium]
MADKRELKGSSLMLFADEYVSLDIETTGLSPETCEIIEIGAVRVSEGKVTEEFQKFIRPDKPVPDFITSLTGITNEMVADADGAEAVLAEFEEFLGDSLIVGQNVNFDIGFLYDNMLKYLGIPMTNDFADCLRISRNLFPELPNHKLATLVKHFGLSQSEAHRALSDSYDAFRCYEHMRCYAEKEMLLVPDKKGMRLKKRPKVTAQKK